MIFLFTQILIALKKVLYTPNSKVYIPQIETFQETQYKDSLNPKDPYPSRSSRFDGLNIPSPQ